MICPACKGERKILITVTTYGNAEPNQSFSINCSACGGSGKVTKRQYDIWKSEQDMWCKCKLTNTDYANGAVYYVPDGVNDEVSKHHYRHDACGKVVQIG